MKKKKRYIPWWMRRRESCPDCGWSSRNELDVEIMLHDTHTFTCPRCGVIYSEVDFWEEQYEKYRLTMAEECV